MGLVVGTIFYVHTFMCAIYLFYLVKKVIGTTTPRRVTTDGTVDDFFDDLSGSDERAVQVTAYAVLGLYLLFTEAYLYRTYQIFVYY